MLEGSAHGSRGLRWALISLAGKPPDNVYAVGQIAFTATFNVGGHKYRLVVRVHYVRKIVGVKFVGTHAEYDQVNVREL